MSEKTIHLVLHVPNFPKFNPKSKIWKWGLGAVFVLTLVAPIATESITLSTYYPAPAGAYNNMVTIGNTWLARDPMPSGGTSFVELGSNAAVGGNTKLAVENGNILIGNDGTPLTAPELLSIYGSGTWNGVLVQNGGGNNVQLFDDGNGHLESGSSGQPLWINGDQNAPTYIDSGGGGTVINQGGGNVSIGPGIGPSGDGNSYLHVNGNNCLAEGQNADNQSCAALGCPNCYATWAPGLYVEGQWNHSREQWGVLNPSYGWVDLGIDCNGQWNGLMLNVYFNYGGGSWSGWEDICSMAAVNGLGNNWYCCPK